MLIGLFGILTLLLAHFVKCCVNGSLDKVVLNGKHYFRRMELVKCEVEDVLVKRDGTKYCSVHIPSLNGSALLPMDDETSKLIFRQNQNGNNGPTGAERPKIMLFAMYTSESESYVRPPEADTMFLTQAKLEPDDNNEVGIKEADSIQNMVIGKLYSRDALIVVGAVLLIVSPIASILCGVLSIVFTCMNKPFVSDESKPFTAHANIFTLRDKSGIIWVKVTGGCEPAVKTKSVIHERISDTEKIISEAKSSAKLRKLTCKNCGVILDDTWSFCPHCGTETEFCDRPQKESNEDSEKDDCFEESCAQDINSDDEFDEMSAGIEEEDFPLELEDEIELLNADELETVIETPHGTVSVIDVDDFTVS